jgi:hypothetical protein
MTEKKSKKKEVKKTKKSLVKQKKTIAKEIKAVNKKLDKAVTDEIEARGLITLTAKQKEKIKEFAPVMSRNSALTFDAVEGTLFCIQNGMKRKGQICRYLGISRTTLDRWIDAGLSSDDPQDPYYQYVQMFNKAIELYRLKHYMLINKKADAGDKDSWRASAELLDRAFPEDRINKVTDTQVEVAIGEKKVSKELSEINEDKLRLVSLKIQQTFFDKLVGGDDG